MSGTGLAVSIKKAELATSDLLVLVKISNLTCKEVLVGGLTKFMEEARTTAAAMHTLNAKADGAVDRCVLIYSYRHR